MALINRKGSIVLSERDGTEFSKKMTTPDAEVMERRNKFLDDARSKIFLPVGVNCWQFLYCL